MDNRKLKKLIDLFEKTGLKELEVREDNWSVRLTKDSTMAVSVPQMIMQAPAETPVHLNHTALSTASSVAPLPTPKGHLVHSPMVGTLYSSPSPEAPPFVTIGQSVKPGDTLCIIEAMKMFNEIECDRAGTIVDILVSNGDPVEYDQILFVIE